MYHAGSLPLSETLNWQDCHMTMSACKGSWECRRDVSIHASTHPSIHASYIPNLFYPPIHSMHAVIHPYTPSPSNSSIYVCKHACIHLSHSFIHISIHSNIYIHSCIQYPSSYPIHLVHPTQSILPMHVCIQPSNQSTPSIYPFHSFIQESHPPR